MKKLHFIALTFLFLFFLVGCATSMGKKQLACEEQYSSFEQVVSCTKDSFMKDKFAKVNDPSVKLYFLKGDQLVEKLNKKEITEIDARTEWQKLYVELKNQEENRSSAAAAAYGANKIKQTHCVPIGNSVSCTTY